MQKRSTQQDYARRLMRVVKLIWQDPTRHYSLEQLAEAANFSAFHFHRIYRDMMGETVSATQQRLRLHFASRDLAVDAVSQIRVAQRAGFQSSAAFVRAFTVAYGVTPGAYRRQRLHLLQLKTKQEKDMYQVEIRKLNAPIQLAARRHLGPFLNLDEAFSLLELEVGKLPLPAQPRWFGLFYDDPEHVREGVVGPELRSDACVEITSESDLPASLHHVQIPAGRFAVIEHKGAYSELDDAYQWLIGQWLQQSNEEPASVPGIELYLNDACQTAPKDLRTEIWLALAD
jgi:AraC family transcriptional regulator